MTLREKREALERETLHPSAALSEKSKGRLKDEAACEIRTCFQRDRDRIIHAKAFRRLKHKTQVFFAPKGDHYRTRLTHVLEVSQIARTIAMALGLNEDLTEAIALGHDLGHTPFGHAGEAVLREIHPGGFDHYKQSLRVVDFLEKDGKGLNLSYEVRNGIVRHSKGKGPIFSEKAEHMAVTFEGQVVRVSDIIAYLNHDLDDALRAEVIRLSDIPQEILSTFGDTHSKRIDTMVKDLIYQTLKTDLTKIGLSEEILAGMNRLRDFLYKRVYESDPIVDEFNKAKKILRDLYEYYLTHIEEVLGTIPTEERIDRHRITCDFIAGMTDMFALTSYERLFIPQQWTVL